MKNRAARISAFAGWLLEVSALLAVFPVLDQLVRDVPFNWALATIYMTLALILFSTGLYLTRWE
jgi:hypothetical protein